MAITKLDRSTINGFIRSFFKSVTKLIIDFRADNEPRLSNSLSYSAQGLWSNPNIGGNVF